MQKLKKDPNILQQLSNHRKTCFENLLNNQISIQTDQDLELNVAVRGDRANEIIRYIRPEQPLSIGEIVHIIKHDQLYREEEKDFEYDSGASR